MSRKKGMQLSLAGKSRLLAIHCGLQVQVNQKSRPFARQPRMPGLCQCSALQAYALVVLLLSALPLGTGAHQLLPGSEYLRSSQSCLVLNTFKQVYLLLPADRRRPLARAPAPRTCSRRQLHQHPRRRRQLRLRRRLWQASRLPLPRMRPRLPPLPRPLSPAWALLRWQQHQARLLTRQLQHRPGSCAS